MAIHVHIGYFGVKKRVPGFGTIWKALSWKDDDELSHQKYPKKNGLIRCISSFKFAKKMNTDVYIILELFESPSSHETPVKLVVLY